MWNFAKFMVLLTKYKPKEICIYYFRNQNYQSLACFRKPRKYIWII